MVSSWGVGGHDPHPPEIFANGYGGFQLALG
jgi:hypothetical protein